MSRVPGERAIATARRDVLRAAGVGTGALTLGPTAGIGLVGAENSVDETTQTPPRLSVEGNRIVTDDGEDVTLRGLNVIDPKRANGSTADRGRTPTETIDLLTDASAGWHPDVIRVPVQPIDIGDHEAGQAPEPIAFTAAQLESYLDEHLDPVLKQCADAGVYAIVDFHRHWPEVQWGDDEAGTINETLQAETLQFWETVAPRYAADDHVLYEVYNEPTEPGMWDSIEESWVQDVWELYLEFIQPVVDEIRTHTDTVVLVGSPGWSSSPEGALIEPVAGENVGYTYHAYPGHESSQQGDWEDSAINGQGVEAVYEEYPVFVTEFGWRDYDDSLESGTTAEFGEPFMEWLESHDSIHWMAWVADVWWEPAMFQPGFDGTCDDPPCEWELLGRDAGSEVDMGEYLRQALEVGGVPDNYWSDEDGDADGGGRGVDTGEEDEDETDSGNDDEDGSEDSVDGGDDEPADQPTGSGDQPSDDGSGDDDSDASDDSVPGFGIVATAAGLAGGAAVAARRRLDGGESE
ncbi:glycoside hydrolase family 5 protein [Halobacteria archaeon AArc-dxtr1]|nr:glycoside hydrolase family 5 protein [Halobacteria archaeon AArc-dxtr1]